MNILYVENHSVFAENAKRQFLSHPSVLIVPSIAAARQALQTQTFDLLLVDYDLDDGKGDELIRFVRGFSSRPLIIGVSSHEEGNKALLSSGAAVTCSKM